MMVRGVSAGGAGAGDGCGWLLVGVQLVGLVDGGCGYCLRVAVVVVKRVAGCRCNGGWWWW